MKSTETYTLKDFINSKDDSDITYDTFDILDVSVNGDTFMSRNILRDYQDDLIDISYNLYLSEEELSKYRYRPRLLSHRIYGNPNYYYMILLVNNMCDEKQFNRSPIKILKPKDMLDAISQIYNTNKDFISGNNSRIEKKSEYSK